MNTRNALQSVIQKFTAIFCIAALASGHALWANPQQPAPTSSENQSARLPADQLDSLVAPIALYPDPLLSQVLIASTYPLETIQLQQWLAQNKKLKDKALADAVQKQGWDPGLQASAALPDVVKLLADNINGLRIPVQCFARPTGRRHVRRSTHAQDCSRQGEP